VEIGTTMVDVLATCIFMDTGSQYGHRMGCQWNSGALLAAGKGPVRRYIN